MTNWKDSERKVKNMAKFTKYNNPNRKKVHRTVKKWEYIPTREELDRAAVHGLNPEQYINVKFGGYEK